MNHDLHHIWIRIEEEHLNTTFQSIFDRDTGSCVGLPTGDTSAGPLCGIYIHVHGLCLVLQHISYAREWDGVQS